MPVKKRVSKKPRASKSSISSSSSRVMKRTQRKSKGKKTRTVKRRKQKAGTSSKSVDWSELTIIKLSKKFYDSLFEHITSFNCDETDVKEEMKNHTGEYIYISAEHPNIGIIKGNHNENGAVTIDINPIRWKTIIKYIKEYYNFIKRVPGAEINFFLKSGETILDTKEQLEQIISKFGETCDITQASKATPGLGTKLKNFCRVIFKKTGQGNEEQLIVDECEGE